MLVASTCQQFKLTDFPFYLNHNMDDLTDPFFFFLPLLDSSHSNPLDLVSCDSCLPYYTTETSHHNTPTHTQGSCRKQLFLSNGLAFLVSLNLSPSFVSMSQPHSISYDTMPGHDPDLPYRPVPSLIVSSRLVSSRSHLPVQRIHIAKEHFP